MNTDLEKKLSIASIVIAVISIIVSSYFSIYGVKKSYEYERNIREYEKNMKL